LKNEGKNGKKEGKRKGGKEERWEGRKNWSERSVGLKLQMWKKYFRNKHQ